MVRAIEFVRLSWLDLKIQSSAVVRESEHPCLRDHKWSEISIADAQALTIRLDGKSKSDASDKLRFAVLASPGILGTDSRGWTQV